TLHVPRMRQRQRPARSLDQLLRQRRRARAGLDRRPRQRPVTPRLVVDGTPVVAAPAVAQHLATAVHHAHLNRAVPVVQSPLPPLVRINHTRCPFSLGYPDPRETLATLTGAAGFHTQLRSLAPLGRKQRHGKSAAPGVTSRRLTEARS